MTVVRALLTAAVLTLSACAAEPTTDAPTPPPVPPSSWGTTTARPSTSPPVSPDANSALQLQVDGAADAVAETITYGVGTTTVTLRDVQLPWTSTMPKVWTESAVAVTLQAQLPAGGPPDAVRCWIGLGDQELATATQQRGALCTALVVPPVAW